VTEDQLGGQGPTGWLYLPLLAGKQ
jgi:hypothetical protein